MRTVGSWITFASVLLLAACGGGGGGGDSGGGSSTPPPTPPPPPPPPPPVVSTTATVEVRDVFGFVQPGAVVSIVGATTAPVTTPANGRAEIALRPGVATTLKIAKPEYGEQFAVVTVPEGAARLLDVRILQRAPAQTLPDAAAGGTLTGRNAVRLTLPANALVNAQGQPVTGAIEVRMTPVNTNSHEIGAFPGTMIGNSGGTSGPLATYGPVEFELTQNGQPLQVASGRRATIEMPLYATNWPDGRAIAVGERMPVWSLNETTGEWTQEGEGDIVASRSGTGLALRAEVSHFSWWNPDVFAQRVTVTVNFTLPSGATPTACCSLTAQTVSGPGPAGTASTTLPVTGGTVIVNGGTTYRFTGRGFTANNVLVGAVTVNIPGGAATASVTIPLEVDPDAPLPTIVTPTADATTYTRGTLGVAVAVSGGTPDSVQLFASNSLLTTWTAPPFSFAWDTTTAAEGTYNLRARARRGTLDVDSATRTVVVDRTPPVISLRVPAAGSVANSVAAITATFNEPVNPDTVTDGAISLRSGSTTGPLLAKSLAVSADGRTVTLSPTVSLPTGVSLFLRASDIADRAGNVMAVDAWSFTIPAFVVESPDLGTPNPGAPGTLFRPGNPVNLELTSAGLPIVGWSEVRTSQALHLSGAAFGATGWTLLDAFQTTASVASSAMALSTANLPVFAYVQETPQAQLPGCTGFTTYPQLFVREFTATGSQALGQALNIAACGRPSLPDILREGNTGYVVAFAEANRAYVRRFENNTWVTLGGGPIPAGISGTQVSRVKIARAPNGELHAAWVEFASGGAGPLYVARLVGGAWVPAAGGPLLVDTGAGFPTFNGETFRLGIDPAGRPVVAYVKQGRVYVRRLEGSTWRELGGGFIDQPLQFASQSPSIAISSSGQPVVAWDQDGFGVFLRAWDNVSEQWLPAIQVTTGGDPSELQRDPATNKYWIAYRFGLGGRQLFVSGSTVIP
jgi:hypothetical protein